MLARSAGFWVPVVLAGGLAGFVGARVRAERRSFDPRAQLGIDLYERIIPPERQLRLEEILTSARGGEGQDEDPSEWVEIHNPTAQPVSLRDLWLSDDPARPKKLRLPNAAIAPGGYHLITLSKAAPFHLRQGEVLVFSTDEVTIDRVELKEQREGISYGRGGHGFGSAFVYFISPTPGAANDEPSGQRSILDPPHFSRERGFLFGAAADGLVQLFPPAGAEVRYTLDGSEPTETHGVLYRSALDLVHSTAIRARAFRFGHLPSRVSTHTFLALEEVLAQSASPPGFPPAWKGRNETVPGLYGLRVGQRDSPDKSDLKKALSALPVLVLTLPNDDLFSSERGIYSNPEMRGREWERPVAVEWIPANRIGSSFQIDAGLRIMGGDSRDPARFPKHNLKLHFRGEYGDAFLRQPIFGPAEAKERFKTLALQANIDDSWARRFEPDLTRLERALYIRDAFGRETHRQMGARAARSRFVHLFLNTLYWGLYELMEVPDQDFDHGKGSYDVLRGAHEGIKVLAGKPDIFQDTLEAARALGPEDAISKIGTKLDVDSFADFILLHRYLGSRDAIAGDFYAARPRDGSSGFRFWVWDLEDNLNEANDDIAPPSTSGGPLELQAILMKNEGYRRRFRSRLNLHFGPRGALYVDPVQPAFDLGAPERNVPAARLHQLSQSVEKAIPIEAVRWAYLSGLSFGVERWRAERTRLLSLLAARSKVVKERLEAELAAP